MVPLVPTTAGIRLSLARLVLMAGLCLGATGALMLASPSQLPAQETTTILTIQGRLVNGTADAGNPGALPVLMLVTGPDGTLSGTGQTLAAPDGSFTIDDVAMVEGGSYTISVDYDGVFYGQSLLAEQLSDEVVVTVHEVTEDAGIVHVDRQVMVISDIDVARRVATATEFVRFINPTDRTLRPNLETARPGMFSFMRFALPPDAAEVTVQSNLRGGEIISVGSGFALTAAVPPGAHSVDIAYTFPYEGGRLEYRNSLPQGADIFQVLVPEQWSDLEVRGLTARPPVGIGDEVYRAWEARDIPAGPGVQLGFDGLPQPGVLSQVGNTLSGGSFWITAIPSAMGAVLLGMLLLGVFHRYHPALATGEGADMDDEDYIEIENRQRAELVASLALLDERYERGGMDRTEYVSQRATLVARALGNPALINPAPINQAGTEE